MYTDKPLNGKFIGIKANILTKTSVVPSTASSKTLADYHPPFHATVVKHLISNGANILPNANMDEFGMGSHSQYSHFGPVQSPFKRDGVPLSPGGSSGGSAAWVASKLCWAALGTDTGGSVRLPAAYMGQVGFKPSYGRLSRWGVIQYANSLDTVGILAEKTEDARTLYRCLDHYDEQDPTSLPLSLRERIRSNAGKRDPSHLRIGIPLEYNIQELSPAVRETYATTLNTLQAAGHTLHPVSLPSTRRALSAYYILAAAEASSNLAKYDGIRYGHRTSTSDASPNSTPPLPLYAQTRSESFGDEVKRRILLGAYTLSSEAIDNYFIQAQKIRRLVQRDFDRVFALDNPLLDATEDLAGEVDVLLTPTAPTLPPTAEELKRQSAVESYMNDVFTVPASLAGLPAVSVPVPLPESQLAEMDELDVRTAGMQIIGQFGDDELVLEAAEMLEKLRS